MEQVTNDEAVNLIKKFEGFSSRPYLCPSNIYTISYGAIYGLDGHRVQRDHREITEEEGEFLLRRDLSRFEVSVARLLKQPLTLNQFSACVSLAFNIGSGNFQKSQIRMRLNRREYSAAADIWWQWRRGGGRILSGLVKRREAEKQLFLKED
jgi:GH24 family phage-related lysozyme (muramidase)